MTEFIHVRDRAVSRFGVVSTIAVLAVALAFGAEARPALAQVQDSAAAASAQRDTAAQAQSRRPRRRASPRMSNVGYVDNAIIGTQIQLRGDLNAGIRRADRAEFIQGKCGCYRQLGLDPDAPGAADPGVEDPFSESVIGTDLDYTDIVLDIEYAFHPRVSVFVEVPYRTAQVEGLRDWTGWGDAQAGIKAAILMRPDRWVTAQVRSYLPTGKASNGLGTGHVSVEPALLLYNELSDRARLEAEIRYWMPFGGSTGEGLGGFDEDDDYSGSILRWGAGLGYDLTPDGWLHFTPVFEVVGWHVMGGLASFSEDGSARRLESEDAAGTTIVNAKVGARIGLGWRHDLFAGIGFGLTDATWYDRIIRVEYRVDL